MDEKVNQLILNFEKLRGQLNRLMKHFSTKRDEILRIQREMILVAKSTMKLSVSSFLSSKMELYLWQDCFYKIYKCGKRNCSESNSTREWLLSFIQEGNTYYNYLLRSIKSNDHASTLCSYQYLVHLGDIHRYLYLESPSYEGAQSDPYKVSESYYLEAVRLDPTQGNAYHQLSILSSYRHSYCLTTYYCIRSISCDTPFMITMDNIRNHFHSNEQELKQSAFSFFPLNKKRSTQFLSLQYIQLHNLLLENTNTLIFTKHLKQFEEVLIWSLEHSSLSTPLLFRMLVIAIFAATDAWRFIRNPSQSPPNYLTESQLLGWILLYSLLLRVIQYTAIPAAPNQSHQLNLRYISTVSTFLKWLSLQEENHYRPINYENDMELPNIESAKKQFEAIETQVWKELELLRGRLPPVEIEMGKKHPPLLFEEELIGLRLFGDMFDELDTRIPAATGNTEKELYLVNIHLYLNKVAKQHRSLKRVAEETIQDPKRFCGYTCLITNTIAINQNPNNSSLHYAF